MEGYIDGQPVILIEAELFTDEQMQQIHNIMLLAWIDVYGEADDKGPVGPDRGIAQGAVGSGEGDGGWITCRQPTHVFTCAARGN